MCISSVTSENATASSDPGNRRSSLLFDSGGRRLSLQFNRQVRSTVVADETKVAQPEETNESVSTFYAKLNDIASKPSKTTTTLTTRRENFIKRRRSGPDDWGRINKKECHSLAFAEIFFSDLFNDGE